MFIAIIFVVALLTWRYADWKNWQKYQATMLYFSFGNLLYNFVYHDHFLWQFKPDFMTNHHVTEVIYTFTVFPLTALLYLSNFPPEGHKKQLIYIAKYILAYVGVEFLLFMTGRIEYNHGWSIWWSIAWNCMMFPVLAIHYRKPLSAFMIGTASLFLMNSIFPFKLD